MPTIFIHGTPGTLSVQKYAEIVQKVSQAVVDVRMLELRPEQVTVHLPTDSAASLKPKEQKITIEIINLHRTPLRSPKVISILQSKVIKTVAKLFPSASLIECSKVELCDPADVTVVRRRHRA